MSEHSVLSASSAHRWAVCPRSVAGEDSSNSNRAAAEGTLGHSISELVLTGRPVPPIGSTHNVEGFDFTLTEDFMADVYKYTNAVADVKWQGQLNVERKVWYAKPLGVPMAKAFGTSDLWGFAVVDNQLTLDVGDLKFGRKPVSPERNPQMGVYAAGAMESISEAVKLPRHFPVRLSIYQPRVSRNPFRWNTSVGWVEDLMNELRKPAQAALRFHENTQTQEDEMLYPESPGGHCTYCKRQGACKALKAVAARSNSRAVGIDWSVEQSTFAARDAIRGYLETLEEYATAQAMRGNILPGTKLIMGRAGNPKFVVADAKLDEVATTFGVLDKTRWQEVVRATPAKYRDAIKKAGATDEVIDSLMERSPAKPIIADANDPRPAVASPVGSAFTGIVQI